jgi:hypothetical protein
MDPAGHFLIVFLPWVIYNVARYQQPPSGIAILVLLFATQLPDLIDKPLAWTFGILPSGRMVAHSLVIAIPFVVAVVLLARQRGYGDLGIVFAVGYLSHLAADFYPVMFLGRDYYFFPNMFWPLMTANPDHEPSFAAHLPDMGLATIVTVGFVVLIGLYALVDSYRRIGVQFVEE